MATRVLLDATPLDGPHSVRGIGAYVRGLIAGFAALDPASRPELLVEGSEPAPHGFRIHPVRLPGWRVPRVPDPWPGWIGGRAIRRLDPELLHATHPGLAPAGVPSVVTCHDLIPLRYPAVYLGGWRGPERAAFNAYLDRLAEARLVLVPSAATGRDVEELAGVPESRIRVVPHGVPTPHADPPSVLAMEARGRQPSGPYVLYVGSLEPHKNPRLPLEALAHVPAHTGVRLVMAGPWSRRRHHQLVAQARRLGVAERCRLLSYVPADRLAALRADALAVLVPSLVEGFGFPALEAMAAGVPVMVSEDAALREVVGDAGVLLPTRDPVAWAEAIGRLADDPAERERLSQAGRARAAEFDWLRTATLTQAAYREALGD